MLPSRAFLPLVAVGTLAFAASAEEGENSDPAKKPLTEEQCELLVEQLANPEKPPFDKRYVLRLPKGVSELTLSKAQKSVAAAYDELSENIEVALPVLVRHIRDKRYSYTYEDGISGVYENATVAQACATIIQEHVEVYRRHVTKPRDNEGRTNSLWFIDECGGIEKWWEGREGRSLAELQRDGIEWALQHEKPDYLASDKEWTEAKNRLKKLADQIRASGKPIAVKHGVQFFSR
jgi:hypothetical protein